MFFGQQQRPLQCKNLWAGRVKRWSISSYVAEPWAIWIAPAQPGRRQGSEGDCQVHLPYVSRHHTASRMVGEVALPALHKGCPCEQNPKEAQTERLGRMNDKQCLSLCPKASTLFRVFWWLSFSTTFPGSRIVDCLRCGVFKGDFARSLKALV